jgi:hypothetical protein
MHGPLEQAAVAARGHNGRGDEAVHERALDDPCARHPGGRIGVGHMPPRPPRDTQAVFRRPDADLCVRAKNWSSFKMCSTTVA